jgi:hypothetical protein
METFLGVLLGMKCMGVHATVAAGNVEVEGFFKALGFERYPGVLDGGDSGEEGRTGGPNAMLLFVKTLGSGRG